MSMRPAATAITSSTCSEREPAQEVGADRREQAADADPEEARQQDEVREVRQQADVGRHPPDQRDLEEQDEEGNQEEPGSARIGGGIVYSARFTRLEPPIPMRVHLVNPSHVSFGVGVITPRWLFVLAAATPARYGDPIIIDETLEPLDLDDHRGRAMSSASASTPATPCAATRSAGWRARAGPTSSSAASTPRSIPTKRHELGGAHAVVKGDGDVVWGRCSPTAPRARRSGSTTAAGSTASDFVPARWDLLPEDELHVGVGADRARLPEALLVLLGVADRRPEAAAARRRRGRRGDRRAAAQRASASSRWPTTTSIRSR